MFNVRFRARFWIGLQWRVGIDVGEVDWVGYTINICVRVICQVTFKMKFWIW